MDRAGRQRRLLSLTALVLFETVSSQSGGSFTAGLEWLQGTSYQVEAAPAGWGTYAATRLFTVSPFAGVQRQAPDGTIVSLGRYISSIMSYDPSPTCGGASSINTVAQGFSTVDDSCLGSPSVSIVYLYCSDSRDSYVEYMPDASELCRSHFRLFVDGTRCGSLPHCAAATRPPTPMAALPVPAGSVGASATQTPNNFGDGLLPGQKPASSSSGLTSDEQAIALGVGVGGFCAAVLITLFCTYAKKRRLFFGVAAESGGNRYPIRFKPANAADAAALAAMYTEGAGCTSYGGDAYPPDRRAAARAAAAVTVVVSSASSADGVVPVPGLRPYAANSPYAEAPVGRVVTPSAPPAIPAGYEAYNRHVASSLVASGAGHAPPTTAIAAGRDGAPTSNDVPPPAISAGDGIKAHPGAYAAAAASASASPPIAGVSQTSQSAGGIGDMEDPSDDPTA